MKFNLHYIGSNYQELSVDEISTGTMDKREAMEQAAELMSVASDLLDGASYDELSSQASSLHDALLKALES